MQGTDVELEQVRPFAVLITTPVSLNGDKTCVLCKTPYVTLNNACIREEHTCK